MKPTQLPLFASKPADRAATLPHRPTAHAAGYLLAERIARLLREPVDVDLTDNAWTMVSFKRLHGRVRFRLHHMFSAANDDVVRALVGFTGRNRRAHGRAIDDYIRRHRDLIRAAPERPQQRSSRASTCTTSRMSSMRALAGAGACAVAGGARSRWVCTCTTRS